MELGCLEKNWFNILEFIGWFVKEYGFETIALIFTPYMINKFQYKAQKDIALINPRIEFKKKFDQIWLFDYHEHSLLRQKYIDEYEKNLIEVKLEANLLFDRKIAGGIDNLIVLIQNEFNNFDNTKDLAALAFSKRDGKFIDSFILSLKNNLTIVEEHKNIEEKINNFIYG